MAIRQALTSIHGAMSSKGREIPTDIADYILDPVLYAGTFLYILNKQKRRVRLDYNAAQREYLTNRTGRDLVLKARQLGMSTVIQAEQFRRATTSTVSAATLAHLDDSTQKLRRMSDRFWQFFPVEPKPKRRYANARLTSYTDFDSEVMIATAGSPQVGRAGTYTHVHGSEVAFWKDAGAIMAGLMQGGDPDIVLESTPNGAQGYFYERCMEALDGNPDWRLHFFPWWWEPAYSQPVDEPLDLTGEEQALRERHNLTIEQIAWRRAKQRELKHLFLQEYPEDPMTCFLLSGRGYFGNVEHCFTAQRPLAPSPDHLYVAGLDFAQSQDYTVLVIVDATAKQMVDMVRVNRLTWKEMRRRCLLACKQWGVKTLIGEANSMGTTNTEALIDEAHDMRINTQIVSFMTTHDSKAGIMAELHSALHEGGLGLLDYPELKQELRAYEATQTKTGLWSLNAPDGMHDDTVIALALAWRAVHNRAAPLVVDDPEPSKWTTHKVADGSRWRNKGF
jgi:hypothetical protein